MARATVRFVFFSRLNRRLVGLSDEMRGFITILFPSLRIVMNLSILRLQSSGQILDGFNLSIEPTSQFCKA